MKRLEQFQKNIPCIRAFKEALENEVLSRKLSVTESTIREYLGDCELVLRTAGITYDEVPTKQKAMTWLSKAENKFAKKTLAKRVVAFNHFIRLVYNLDWQLPTPKHIEREYEPKPLSEERVFDMVEFYETRRTPKPTKAMLIFVGFTCAARSGALLRIRLEDIDSDSRTILLRKTKRGKSRRVPLSKKAMDRIRKYIESERPEPKNIEDRPYLFIEEKERVKATYQYFTHSIKYVAYKLKIPTRVHTHILRHSRIKDLRAKGHSWEEVLTLTGHADIRSLSDYIHSEDVDKLQQSLDNDDTPTNTNPNPSQETQDDLLIKVMKENERLKSLLQAALIQQENKAPKMHEIGYA